MRLAEIEAEAAKLRKQKEMRARTIAGEIEELDLVDEDEDEEGAYEENKTNIIIIHSKVQCLERKWKNMGVGKKKSNIKLSLLFPRIVPEDRHCSGNNILSREMTFNICRQVIRRHPEFRIKLRKKIEKCLKVLGVNENLEPVSAQADDTRNQDLMVCKNPVKIFTAVTASTPYNEHYE
jgi:hypothetical protein